MSVVPIEGKHIVLDVYNGDKEKLNDPEYILGALREAAIAAGATVLKSEYVKFEGEGVTAFLILSESHISTHTWPSEGFAAFDIYTCGSCDPDKGIEVLIHKFNVTQFSTQKIKRGNPL